MFNWRVIAEFFICFYFCITFIDKNKRSSILPCNYPILNFIFSPLTRASDQMNLTNVLIISTTILQRAFMSTFVVRCLRKINCSFLSFLPLASCREGKHMLRWKEVVRMTFYHHGYGIFIVTEYNEHKHTCRRLGAESG